MNMQVIDTKIYGFYGLNSEGTAGKENKKQLVIRPSKSRISGRADRGAFCAK